MKTLLAGPWVGEFGWELFCWQGWIRKESRKYDKTIIATRKSSFPLYEDFADEFIEIEAGKETSEIHCYDSPEINLDVEFDRWVSPSHVRYTFVDGVPSLVKEQEFIKYGIENKRVNSIVIHARNTDKVGQGERNWPKKYWETLIEPFKHKYKFYSIGTSDAAYHIPGTIDLRDEDLNVVFDVLRFSKCVIGPSSGPMHLGALCGTPVLVWSGHDRNKARYNKVWNPHGNLVEYVEGWQPDVTTVSKHLNRFLFSMNDNWKP